MLAGNASPLLSHDALAGNRQLETGNWKLSLKSHDVVAAIDVNHLAGDAAAGIGGEEPSGAANFADLHVAPHGGALGVGLVHVAEAGDAARGEGFDRSGRDRVHADIFLA